MMIVERIKDGKVHAIPLRIAALDMSLIRLLVCVLLVMKIGCRKPVIINYHDRRNRLLRNQFFTSNWLNSRKSEWEKAKIKLFYH